MSNSQTTVVWAGLVIKDGFIEKFKEAVEPVVKASREEVGCLKYDFLQDVYNPNTFYFFEEYKDETAFQSSFGCPSTMKDL